MFRRTYKVRVGVREFKVPGVSSKGKAIGKAMEMTGVKDKSAVRILGYESESKKRRGIRNLEIYH